MEDYLLDYLIENGKTSFKNKPWNIYDAFIFSLLSYVPFEEAKVKKMLYNQEETKKLVDELDQTNYQKRKKKEVELLKQVLNSLRYEGICIYCPYGLNSSKEQERFFGVTFILKDLAYVSFRGTDASLIGWKEDLNMSYIFPIPAQVDGDNYLKNILDDILQKPIYIGGHSKGGNIAVYAASKNNIENIKEVYSFDGPGFMNEFYRSIDYIELFPKIRKFVPESSVIGLLLDPTNHYQVIKSCAKNVMQHDPFTWIIKDNHFVYCPDISSSYKELSKSINEWVEQISLDDRKIFCDAIFETFQHLNISEFRTWKENLSMITKGLPLLVPYLKKLDKKTASVVKEITKAFVKIYFNNVVEVTKQKIKQ